MGCSPSSSTCLEGVRGMWLNTTKFDNDVIKKFVCSLRNKEKVLAWLQYSIRSLILHTFTHNLITRMYIHTKFSREIWLPIQTSTRCAYIGALCMCKKSQFSFCHISDTRWMWYAKLALFLVYQNWKKSRAIYVNIYLYWIWNIQFKSIMLVDWSQV